MRAVNQVTLLGRCGKPPAVNPKKTRLRFSLATTLRYKKQGSDAFEEHTDWHEVVVFGERTIDFLVKNLTRGVPVFVQGRLRSFALTHGDKTVRCWEVIAEEVVPLAVRAGAGQDSGINEEPMVGISFQEA
jgi:single-strand DNA-binding protein